MRNFRSVSLGLVFSLCTVATTQAEDYFFRIEERLVNSYRIEAYFNAGGFVSAKPKDIDHLNIVLIVYDRDDNFIHSGTNSKFNDGIYSFKFNDAGFYYVTFVNLDYENFPGKKLDLVVDRGFN